MIAMAIYIVIAADKILPENNAGDEDPGELPEHIWSSDVGHPFGLADRG
jgi:hypothetical protein